MKDIIREGRKNVLASMAVVLCLTCGLSSTARAWEWVTCGEFDIYINNPQNFGWDALCRRQRRLRIFHDRQRRNVD